MFDLRTLGFRPFVSGPLKECDPAKIEILRALRRAASRTPLVDLSSLGVEVPNHNKIVAKLEMRCSPDLPQNPNAQGSHYYRVYPRLLEMLLRHGITHDEYALIEVSSGSVGEALAHTAKIAGFEAHCVFPAEISEKRRSLTAAHGGVIHLPEQEIDGFGIPAAVNKLRRMLAAKELNGKKLYCPNHAHIIETSQALADIPLEILDQLPSIGATKPDIFICAAGNGSSIYSVSAPLRVLGAVDRVIAFEYWENPGFFELKYPGRYEAEIGPLPDFSPASTRNVGMPMPGCSGTYGLDFPYLRASVSLVDEARLIRNGEWEETRQMLRDKAGLSVGPTSAASLMTALRIAKEARDKTILIIFYDGGDRY